MGESWRGRNEIARRRDRDEFGSNEYFDRGNEGRFDEREREQWLRDRDERARRMMGEERERNMPRGWHETYPGDRDLRERERRDWERGQQFSGSRLENYGDYRDRDRERDWDRDRDRYRGREEDRGGESFGERVKSWFGLSDRDREQRDRERNEGLMSREWGGQDRDARYRDIPYQGQETNFGAPRGLERDRGFAGRGPKGYQRSDERLREEICDRLTEHPYIDASDVEVSVKGAEVTLQGSVNSRRMKHMIEDICDGVLGIREVHNNIRVQHQQLESGGQGAIPRTEPNITRPDNH